MVSLGSGRMAGVRISVPQPDKEAATTAARPTRNTRLLIVPRLMSATRGASGTVIISIRSG